jgi:hypothetical protein
MAEPVATIAKAISLAQLMGKFVVACDGTYDERLNITEGVQLYGGFKCPGAASAWTRETSGKATVAPTMRGVVLNINGTSKTAPVSIDNFEFDAQDGVDPGESSIAAFVNTPSTVALTNVKLVAGKGVNGADGTVTDLMFPAQTDLNGNAASGDTGGGGKVCTCADGATSKGGKGGDGGAVNATGGGAGSPALAGGAAGTFGAMCAGPGTGGTGSDASPQSPAAGAQIIGSLSSAGWMGEPGASGATGTPGQGGGGGTGADTGGGGGGGGCGGCGGAGAIGGGAGGSSIALLVLASPLSLFSCELSASDAGNGGKGVAGQAGQTQSGSAGVQTPDGCSGGKGGKGGAGGASGGGAGGISVGIAWSGAPDPTPDNVTTTATIQTGTAGLKGVGGVPTMNDGVAGSNVDVLPL